MSRSLDARKSRGDAMPDAIPDAVAAVLVVLILTAMAVHFVSG